MEEQFVSVTVTNDLCSILEKSIVDGGPMLIDILRRIIQYICRPNSKIALPLLSDNWVIKESGGCNTQANVTHHQMVIPFEANISASIVTHIQKATPKSTADPEVVDVIASMASVGRNPTDLMAGSVLEQCATNNKTVESAEIHEPPTITVGVAKAMFPHHMSEQDVVRSS